MACLTTPFDVSDKRCLRQRDRVARLLFTARCVLIALLLIAYPLALLLPGSWGWENGAFEDMQVAVLLAGLVFALLAFRDSTRPLARLGLFAAPFWAIAAARELSWGAVFLTPLEMTADGPLFSSTMLWYRAAIHPVIALFFGVSLVVFLRFRLDRLFGALWRQRRFPFIELGLIVVAALGSTIAEGHTPIDFSMTYAQKEVLEELMELVAYSALLLAQLRMLLALRRD